MSAENRKPGKDTAVVEAVLACGAAKACPIPAENVVLSAEFRRICEENTCGNYGRCYTCPPDIGDIETCMEKIRSFSSALLYQSIGMLEDSFDFEGMMDAAREHALLGQRIEKAVQTLLPPGYLHLSAGGCHLCEKCAKKDGLPCRRPDEILPAMEGCGIDVYRTSLSTDLLYINGQDTVTYFGILLF